MYDRVLVPVDGSDPATAALEHALDIARDAGATVHALNVADTNEPSVVRVGGNVRDVLEREGEEIVSRARDLAEERGVDVVGEVIQGDPRDVIVEYAADRDVDLVAMGAHGRRGVGEYLLGSVTDRVVNTCDVPVLTVRAADDATRRYPYDTVVVPTDGSDHATAALETGAEIANRHGARLHALFVVDTSIPGFDERAAPFADRFREAAEAVLEESRDAAEAADVDRITTTVEFGSVAIEIRAYAVAEDADLLVVGSHGRTGIDERLLGTTTERVVRTAPAPVLTTRRRQSD